VPFSQITVLVIYVLKSADTKTMLTWSGSSSKEPSTQSSTA